MAEGDEWTGDEVELVPGDTTDPGALPGGLVGYLYGTGLDNVIIPDEEIKAEKLPAYALQEDWISLLASSRDYYWYRDLRESVIGGYAYGFARKKKLPLERV